VTEQLVNYFILMFVVIDPIGVAGQFGAMTAQRSLAEQKWMAVRAIVLSALILLFFVLAGDWLLKALGIGLPAFRIAGGLLLLLLSIEMVFARESGLRSTTSGEQDEASRKDDLSVFPLAFPLLAGPGAMTSAMLMSAQTRDSLPMFVGSILILLAVLGLSLLVLLSCGRIMRLLGETGANVIGRLLGVVLAALAVQFMVDGIRSVLS
jgi:multiple antibiotic resistance protein